MKTRFRPGLLAAVCLLASMTAGCSSSNTPSAEGEDGSQLARAEASVRFDVLLSAAFREFAGAGDLYARLHHQYLGVTQAAPDTSSCPVWPDAVVGEHTLRLGFVAEEPLHTVSESGEHQGLEAELGNELVRRINARYPEAKVDLQWVEVEVTLPVGPGKNSAEFSALANGLRVGEFDVAFSSIVPVAAGDIIYLCPMTTMFPGVVYTGRDQLDVSSIRDRESLVEFLVRNPGMTFVHGMGQAVYEALANDVKDAGGEISLVSAGGTPHFRMADILGLSKRSTPAADGILLDVNPRTDVQPRAMFVLRP